MPPQTGASLECLLTCEELEPAVLPRLLQRLGARGFGLNSDPAILGYGEDPVTPTFQMAANQEQRFVQELETRDSHHCIIRLVGTLAGVEANLGLVVDFADKVVSLSVVEGIIWHYTGRPERADIAVVQAFADCCRDFIEELHPLFGIIGPEPAHENEMRLSEAPGRKPESKGAVPVDADFLSDSDVEELFNWYAKDYAEIWDSIPARRPYPDNA
jgi:hypothetical protein